MGPTGVVAVVFLLVGPLAWAQTGTGVIEGTVVDGGGNPVTGAIVTAQHVATGTPYRVKTNELGKYKFDFVPPGTYEVTTAAVAPGTSIRVVKVTTGGTLTADFDPSTPLVTKKENGGGRPIRFEVSGRVGWTFSDGVSGRGIVAGDGNTYDSIDPVDSVSWGFTAGAFLTPRFEIEFLFDRQSSTLRASGTRTVDVSDLPIGNYHGVLSYHFGAPAAALRPYVMGGFGVTTYGSLTFTGADGRQREIGGRNRLSSTFGGGMKLYRGRVGGRVEARVTPTYIRSQATGWWCDDYWGCYLTTDSQFSKQFEVSGGVSFRF